MKTVWETYNAETRDAAMAFAEEYRTFLNATKTERESHQKASISFFRQSAAPRRLKNPFFLPNR